MTVHVTCVAQCLQKVEAQIKTTINHSLSTGWGVPHPHLSSPVPIFLFQHTLETGLPRAAPNSCHRPHSPPQVPEPKGVGCPWGRCWFQDQANHRAGSARVGGSRRTGLLGTSKEPHSRQFPQSSSHWQRRIPKAPLCFRRNL